MIVYNSNFEFFYINIVHIVVNMESSGNGNDIPYSQSGDKDQDEVSSSIKGLVFI